VLIAAWEDAPPSGARANIHSYVSNLRRLLNSVGVDGKSGAGQRGARLRDQGRRRRCRPRPLCQAETAGLRPAAAGKFEDASRHLSEALSEWRGPALEDLRDFAFFDAFATALMDERILTQTARAEAEIACGRSAEIIGELEDVVIEHPYREPLWAQLITAYYLVDRQVDALDAYQRLKTTLSPMSLVSIQAPAFRTCTNGCCIKNRRT
jgi:DNA-binding SARP family transcriptional activator